MTFVEAIKSGFKNYVNFQGRAVRSEYWWWVLFVVLIVIIPDMMMMGELTRGALGLGTGLYCLVLLGTLLPSLGLAIRRLHDTGRSGWWYLIAFTGIGAFVLLFWFCQKGTPGPNKYGIGDVIANVASTF